MLALLRQPVSSVSTEPEALSLTQATVQVPVTLLLTFLLCQPLRWQMGVQVQGQSMTLGKGSLVIKWYARWRFFTSLFPINSVGWGKSASALEP